MENEWEQKKIEDADCMALRVWDDEPDRGIGPSGAYEWTRGEWHLVHGYCFYGGCLPVVSDAKTFDEAVYLLEVAL